METELAERLAILGHPKRLALFRALVRRYPGRVPARELAKILDVPGSTLSGHLAELVRVRLVARERRGTSLLYGAEMQGLRATFEALVLDCCNGRPEACPPLAGQALGPAQENHQAEPVRVAFICTGNSARSILSEALLNHLGGGRFLAVSAGTRPTGQVNPGALAALRRAGIPTDGLRSKDLAELQDPEAPRVDIVVTVCDAAAGEECPLWPGMPVAAHWGLPDPAAVTGDERAVASAFDQAMATIRRRIEAFVALPVASMDRGTLQRALDDIALM